MPELSRRGLITGLVSLVAAPAIVRAGSLMPINICLVPQERLWGAWNTYNREVLPALPARVQLTAWYFNGTTWHALNVQD